MTKQLIESCSKKVYEIQTYKRVMPYVTIACHGYACHAFKLLECKLVINFNGSWLKLFHWLKFATTAFGASLLHNFLVFILLIEDPAFVMSSFGPYRSSYIILNGFHGMDLLTAIHHSRRYSEGIFCELFIFSVGLFALTEID